MHRKLRTMCTATQSTQVETHSAHRRSNISYENPFGLNRWTIRLGQVQLCTKEPEPDIWLAKQRVELEIITGKLNMALIRFFFFCSHRFWVRLRGWIGECTVRPPWMASALKPLELGAPKGVAFARSHIPYQGGEAARCFILDKYLTDTRPSFCHSDSPGGGAAAHQTLRMRRGSVRDSSTTREVWGGWRYRRISQCPRLPPRPSPCTMR